MGNNWSLAAQKYRTAYMQQQRKERDEAEADELNKTRPENPRQQARDLERGVAQLETFMQTDGVAAMELLRASKRHIIFGEEREGQGFGSVFFIDGNGLKRSVEAMGTWIAYANKVPKPKLSSITCREAVVAAIESGKKATEIVSWLRGKLDEISADAPSTK